jgi:hypothetical protein
MYFGGSVELQWLMRTVTSNFVYNVRTGLIVALDLRAELTSELSYEHDINYTNLVF